MPATPGHGREKLLCGRITRRRAETDPEQSDQQARTHHFHGDSSSRNGPDAPMRDTNKLPL
jgi:hypothetical protein